MRVRISKIAGIVALGLLPSVAQAAPFTAGDLVVEQIGDGTTSLTSAAAPVFVNEYTPTGTLVQSIPMPTAVNGSNLRLTDSGSATSDGYLNLSADGKYLTLTGYNAAVGTASVASTSTTGGSATVRVVGVINSNANVDTTTSLTSYSGNNIRSAVTSNGTDIWTSGAGTPGGIIATTLGASGAGTALSTTVTNTRVVGIFGGQLYATSGSGSNKGVNTVGTGLPTSSGTPFALGPASASPYGMFLTQLNPASPGFDTAYVADDGVGIEKFSLVSGSWVASGVIGTASDAYRGLTGSVTANGVQLYATRQGGSSQGVVSLLDTSGYNSTITGSPNLIVALSTNEAFRGIAYAPTPEPGTFVLGGMGLGLLLVARRLRGKLASR
ncbi:MAG TPA: PEP-CTERM sorting domain-containing protein [Pirellulales bacterium]|nr:PEP-CTERM sorting domain-containing protein [Pirellulales bacterium]